MRLQAVAACRFLKIAHMRILAVVAVFTTRAFCRPLAPGRPVVVVTDIVALEFGASTLPRYTPGLGARASASGPSVAAAAGCLVLLALLPVVIVPSSRP